MNVRRFFAPSAREALRRVKEELGGDAIVLANRSVEGGVEILAVPPHELGLSAPSASAVPAAAAQAVPGALRQYAAAAGAQDAGGEADFALRLSSSLKQRGHAKPWQPIAARAAKVGRPQSPAAGRDVAPVPATAVPAAAAQAPAAGAITPAVMDELTAIRGLIERQLAGFAWGELKRESWVKSAVLGELLECGFSARLAHRLLDHVQAAADQAEVRAALRTQLNRELLTLASDTDIIDRGGIYALVGPTGVGKTTTTAKLAARCVVRHGAERIALLTTDGYRIGAHEQLRIYGRILGVAVHAVRDAADLRQTLAELRHKHMVLIDTVGMSQRDRQVVEQTAMLLDAGDVRRLLLLNATSRGDTLEDVVRAYSGPDLAGAILTKVDEAAALAPAVDVLVRQELELFYIANGQRVPEDLHLPNRTYLLHRALKQVPEHSPFRLGGEEPGLILAATPASMPNESGVHLG
jgi:flagellar biosynthesis protein FlhF